MLTEPVAKCMFDIQSSNRRRPTYFSCIATVKYSSMAKSANTPKSGEYSTIIDNMYYQVVLRSTQSYSRALRLPKLMFEGPPLAGNRWGAVASSSSSSTGGKVN